MHIIYKIESTSRGFRKLKTCCNYFKGRLVGSMTCRHCAYYHDGQRDPSGNFGTVECSRPENAGLAQENVRNIIKPCTCNGFGCILCGGEGYLSTFSCQNNDENPEIQNRKTPERTYQ